MAPRLSVKGRDPARETYRIETPAGEAWVPEALMAGLRPDARPTHQQAYAWIAAHAAPLARAVTALQQGDRPRPPYDALTPAEGAE